MTTPPVIPGEVEGSGGAAAPSRPGPSTPARDDINWTRLYIFVIVWLAVQVVAFYAFTKAFE